MNERKRIAIFDTSVIDGEKNTDSFFGGRNELEKFAAVCEVVIPDMVIAEIRKHKIKYLVGEKNRFLINPFRFLLGLKQEEVDALDISSKVDELYVTEPIVHRVIKLSSEHALETIKTMCLGNEAPFEAYKEKSSTDKGFKDSYTLLTVKDYVVTQPDAEIFVIVKDGRFADALSKIPGVKVVKDFEEFEMFNKSKFTEEYFLQRLSETIGEPVTADLVLNVDLNINDNWVLEINTPEKPTFVEVDYKNREIVGSARVRIQNGINNLINSESFDNTDGWVEKLGDYVQYCNYNQLVQLIVGSVSNNQIYWIATKDTLKQFFYPIFEKVENRLDQEMKEKFIEKFEYERR